MNRNKALYTIVVILVLLNTIALVMMWYHHRKAWKQQGLTPAHYLIKKVGFDSSQKDKYLDLVQAHRKNTGKLRQQLADAKDDYFALLGKPIPDSSRQSALQKITSINAQLDEITFNHFEEVRKICTPEQQVKFDKAIQEVIKMMSGPPPGPPHGPPGGPMGPPPPGGPPGD